MWGCLRPKMWTADTVSAVMGQAEKEIYWGALSRNNFTPAQARCGPDYTFTFTLRLPQNDAAPYSSGYTKMFSTVGAKSISCNAITEHNMLNRKNFKHFFIFETSTVY
jgi:hypothetical protein